MIGLRREIRFSQHTLKDRQDPIYVDPMPVLSQPIARPRNRGPGRDLSDASSVDAQRGLDCFAL